MCLQQDKLRGVLLEMKPHASAFPVIATRHYGFTLIELLASIVIISIIASLSLAGLQSARNSGKISKTKATIQKLNEVLLSYYETYETRRVLIPNESSISNRNDLAEVRRIALRRVMTLELPERYSDITSEFGANAYSVNPLPVNIGSYNTGTQPWVEVPPVARRYRSLLDGVDINSPKFSSADLLYMIVMRGPVADPDIISHFRPDEIGDTDGPFADPYESATGNGLKEFVDGWGRPICFKRWPVGFASPLQPVNGLLSSIDQRVSKDGHRLLPLIYSAGPDRQFDLHEDYQVLYRNVLYNPFASGVVQGSQPRGDAGEVVLFPVAWPPAMGTQTYIAVRRASDGSLTTPSLPQGATGVADTGFQTVASERRFDGLGPVRSRDNIHNHDLTR